MPVASHRRSATDGVHAPPAEIAILWLTAGLSCDGDTIAMTAATQPSIEDLSERRHSLDARRSSSHNPFLASEVGDEFVEFFHRGARGELGPFILVVEGSIPDETNKAEGYWATFGTDPATGQPITTCDWIDRLAPRAWAVLAAGTCAAYGGIHAMEGNPTGCDGAARLPRMELAVGRAGSRSSVCRAVPCSRTT